MNSLSVIVITLNEEKNIADCLKSVSWASEIVLVDGGSTDKTLEIARGFTEKTFVKPWEGYGASKNFGLEHCTGDWVLWLDADERVTPGLAEELKGILANDTTSPVAFEIPRKAFFLGKWIRHCGWYPGHVLRLFRRKAGHFSENKVHERLEVSGEKGRLRSDLLHYTDPNLWHYFEKFNRYTTLAAEELSGNRARFKISQLIVRPFWVFVRMYILKRGFLDGIHGLVLSVLSAAYVFTKYAKLWELSGEFQRSNN